MKTRVNYNKMKTAFFAISFVGFGYVCKAQPCDLQNLPSSCPSGDYAFYTPNGTLICCNPVEETATLDDIEKAWAYWTKFWLGQPVEILDISSSYYCFSFAWIMSDPSIMSESEEGIHFLFKGGIRGEWGVCLFWDDGSYETTDFEKAEKIVSFATDPDPITGELTLLRATHAAIKTSDGKIMEKMGASIYAPLIRYATENAHCVYPNLGWAWIYNHPNNPGIIKYYRRCITDFTSQTVISNTTITTGCNIYSKDVNVTNNAKLKLETSGEVTIDGDFEVQLGSELEIK